MDFDVQVAEKPNFIFYLIYKRLVARVEWGCGRRDWWVGIGQNDWSVGIGQSEGEGKMITR